MNLVRGFEKFRSSLAFLAYLASWRLSGSFDPLIARCANAPHF
jgi:hypothetical protein